MMRVLLCERVGMSKSSRSPFLNGAGPRKRTFHRGHAAPNHMARRCQTQSFIDCAPPAKCNHATPSLVDTANHLARQGHATRSFPVLQWRLLGRVQPHGTATSQMYFGEPGGYQNAGKGRRPASKGATSHSYQNTGTCKQAGQSE